MTRACEDKFALRHELVRYAQTHGVRATPCASGCAAGRAATSGSPTIPAARTASHAAPAPRTPSASSPRGKRRRASAPDASWTCLNCPSAKAPRTASCATRNSSARAPASTAAKPLCAPSRPPPAALSPANGHQVSHRYSPLLVAAAGAGVAALPIYDPRRSHRRALPGLIWVRSGDG